MSGFKMEQVLELIGFVCISVVLLLNVALADSGEPGFAVCSGCVLGDCQYLDCPQDCAQWCLNNGSCQEEDPNSPPLCEAACKCGNNWSGAKKADGVTQADCECR